MSHYRSSYEIVAYSYEANIHCLDCAIKRFPVIETDDRLAVDKEGNVVTAVTVAGLVEFDGDVSHCGTCYEEIE